MTIVHNPLGSGNPCQNGTALVGAPRGSSDFLNTNYVLEDYAITSCDGITELLDGKLDDYTYYFGDNAAAGGEEAQPAGLVQLLFAPESDSSSVYYTSAEWSGNTHLLKDESTDAGDVRAKCQPYCLDFDGSTQYIDYGSRLTSGSLTKLFVSAWVKIDAFIDSYAAIALEGATSGKYSWMLRVRSSGDLSFLLSEDGSAFSLNEEAIPGWAVDTWFHVAVHYDGSNYELFINGVSIDSGGGTPSSLHNTTDNLEIGIRNANANEFDGSMYDLRIYTGDDADTAATNIASIYDFSYTGSPVGHFWPQEENGSNVVNAVDGTVTAITNYASSMRVIDSGVRYNINNRLGYSPRMEFDGTDDSISVTSMDLTSIDSDASGFTIKFRGVWLDTSVDAQEGVFTNGSSAGTSTVNLTVNSGSWRWLVSDTTIGQGPATRAAVIGELVEIVCTARITGGNLETAMYVNGTQSGVTESDAIAETDWTYLSTNWIIGHYTSTRYFGGIIDYVSVFDGFSSDGETSGLTEVHRWQNTGITDADWLDEIGSVDGTVNGSPTTITYIPPQSGSTTLDAFGGPLTYPDRVPMYGLVKGWSIVSDGSTAYIDLSSEELIPADGDGSISFKLKATDMGGYESVFRMQYGAGESITLVGRSAPTLELNVDDGVTDDSTATIDIEYDEWVLVTITREGDIFTLDVDGVSESVTIASADFGTHSSTYVLSFSSGPAFLPEASIGPITNIIGGVTTTYVPIKGTRHIAKITSDSSDTSIIYDAVIGGSLDTLYELGDGSWRLPHIENGARWASQNLTVGAAFAVISNHSRDALSDEWYRFTKSVDTSFKAFTFSYTLTGTGVEHTLRFSVRAGNTDVFDVRPFDGTITITSSEIVSGPGSISTLSGVTSVSDLTSEETIVEIKFSSTDVSGRVFFYVDATNSTNNSGNYIEVRRVQINEGSVALPYNATGANIWEASSLIPLDDTGVSPDGNAQNVLANTHDRKGGTFVDRTGGVISDIDYQLGTDHLLAETGENYVEDIEGDW